MLPTLLKIAGVLLICLSMLNTVLSRRFSWAEELPRLSLFNRQMFLVHHFFIALIVAMMGVLLLGWSDALVTPSPLGKPVAAGLTLFWTCRLFIQFFVYDRQLWVGRRFETLAHCAFSALWVYFVAVFGWTLALQCA